MNKPVRKIQYQLLILLLVVLLFTSCATPNKYAEQDKLRSELKKWESFEGQGIVEISAMGLSLRKMFVVAKNHGQLRLDIIDGGIMGAGAVPLISFYAGEYIALKSPFMPMLEMLNPMDVVPSHSLNLFSSADSLFYKHGNDILLNKKLEIESVQISFLPDYRMNKAFDPKTGSEIKASYNNSKTLSQLEMKSQGDMAIKLIFDQIKFIEPEIAPLPKPRAGTWFGNGNPFENMNFKQMLKSFLNN